MLVFFKQRLVILSVPKTGTTALHAALGTRADLVISGPPALKHAPLYRFDRFIRPMYEKVCNAELEVMAVVREPVAWLGSWYRYRQRSEVAGSPSSTAGLSFDAFVTAYCETNTPAYAQVGSQAKFLEPRPNGTKAKHIFAYENPQLLRSFLEDRLGALPAFSRVNVSQRKSLTLSPEVEAQYRQTHAASFALHAEAMKDALAL